MNHGILLLFFVYCTNYQSLSVKRISIRRVSLSFVNNIGHDKRNNSVSPHFSCSKTYTDGLMRREFPIFDHNYGSSDYFIYFDNAASTHKPRSVITAISDFYSLYYSNVDRSLGPLAQRTAREYETAREKIAKFINSECVNEIIITSGATDSINLVANTIGNQFLKEGDVILLPISEHNSNIIPWQIICKNKLCEIKFVEICDDGSIDLKYLETLFQKYNVKLLSIAHASNVLGTIQPIKQIVEIAHKYSSLVLVDACQTLSHITVDVRDLDCDFLVGSGHKMYGPTGIGFLYGKRNILELLEPYKGGGGTIQELTFESTKFLGLPYKFEPGTPPIAQAIGLGAALDFINNVTFDKIHKHEKELVEYLCEKLQPFTKLHGPESNVLCSPIVAFSVDNINSFDLATLLASRKITLRCGKHCAHLLHGSHIKVNNTIRISLAMYNNYSEVDRFVKEVVSCIKLIKGGK